MKNLIKIAKKITILVLAISFFGCTEDDALAPKVVAGFTYTINIDTGTVTFINISENASTYNWNFGDESTSTEINPIKTYPNGTYTISLFAKNVSGASNTFEDTITILIPEKATLPISFDGENTSYDAETFGGASFEVVDNPDPSGANPTVTKVGAITNIGAAFEGFYFDLGSPINLTTNKSISMNFWSDAPINVLLKLEEGTGGPIEATASHGGTGWETIIFNFSSSNSYSRFTMFVDGPGTTAGTFYVDNITQIETPPLPCTAETAESLNAADLNITFMSDDLSVIEDGASFERISNPDYENEVNSSCFVGKVTKLGNNPWDNNQIDLDAKLDFTNNTGLKIKVWSPRENTEVRIKLEEIGNAPNNNEKFTTTTVTSGWEELTFPYTSADSNKFNKIVIFFDLNANNTDTYYFDDVKLYVGDGGGGVCTAETAESLNSADFNLTFKTDQTAKIIADNATFAWISNPDFDNAVNPSCKVGQYVRNPNELYPNHQIDFTTPLSFANNAGFKLKVWTPTVGTKVTVKLEGATVLEVSKTTTVANAWEELTFDFGDNASGNKKIVLFFNVGTNTPGTFYYDDFKLYPRDGGGGNCPAPPSGEFITDGNFEANAGCWELFNNGGTTTISTSVSNGGGSNSGQIKTVQFANPGLKQTRFGVGSIQPNKTYLVKFDIKASSPLVDGAVFQAFTFSEPADGSNLPAAQHILIAGDPNVTASWVTRTYEFTTAANVDGGLSLLFELVCGGAGTCAGTVNIDNVSLKLK